MIIWKIVDQRRSWVTITYSVPRTPVACSPFLTSHLFLPHFPLFSLFPPIQSCQCGTTTEAPRTKPKAAIRTFTSTRWPSTATRSAAGRISWSCATPTDMTRDQPVSHSESAYARFFFPPQSFPFTASHFLFFHTLILWFISEWNKLLDFFQEIT